jgi:acetyl-CoA acetyltransferase
MRDVYVAGIGMHPFGRYPEMTLRDLAVGAFVMALQDSGLSVRAIGAAYVANCLGGLLTGQESIRGEVVLRPVGLRDIPVVNVENACASGATAFRLAYLDVAAGLCEVALALGVEKMFIGDTAATTRALASATDVETAGRMGFSFMGLYAMQVENHLERDGWTKEDLALVTVKNRKNGAYNPYAQFRTEVTPQQVLESKPIAGPLTLFMCSSITDGAAAVILCSGDVVRRIGGPRIRVRASVLRMGAGDFISDSTDCSSVRRAAVAAYEQAGLGPEDLEVIEVHDAVAPAEIRLYEELALCPSGGGVELLRSGKTELSGEYPVNPSGGLVARGHPVGATGLAQIAELVWQMRGQAGRRQVQGPRGDGPRIGLAENNGGFIEGDVAVVAIHILERVYVA